MKKAKEQIKELSGKTISFFKKYWLVFVLSVIVFILLYVYFAERGRRSDLEGQIKQSKKDIIRLENEIIQTKKDFFDLQKKINENDSIFYSIPFDNRLPVDSLLQRMSDRFAVDGVSSISDDRQR